MAIIKKKQLRELSREDLGKRLADLRLDLAKDRTQISVGGSPPNPGKTREKRRTIGRILTQIWLRDEVERNAKSKIEGSKKVQTKATSNKDILTKKHKEVVKTA